MSEGFKYSWLPADILNFATSLLYMR